MNKFKIVYFYVFVFAFSLLATNIFTEKINNSFIELTTKESIETTSSEYKYRISVFNGKIAVFEKDSKLPYKVYDTYVSSLPENDQLILSNGIRVNTASELIKIIEEYTS